MVGQTSATIAELFNLADSGSIGDRTKLVNLICNLRFAKDRELLPEEHIIANDILKQLVKDKSTMVRGELAERLAVEDDAPKELILSLGLDEIEVARPVLRSSECFWDSELVKIVQTRTEEHRLVIAGRNSVSSAVADALLTKGDSTVLSTLLQNKGANLPEGTVEFLNEQTKLLELARNSSAAGRKKLVACVSEFAITTSRKLTENESGLIGDVLCHLVEDVEEGVRAMLAKEFADRSDAPPDLIKLLANDEIDIALPILLRSKMLKDPELIEIVQLRTMQHRLAIATREHVSKRVSDALIDAGEPEVGLKLLENKGALLSDRGMERMVAESERIKNFQLPLLAREDLPPELAGRMYRWVSAALRKHIVNNFDIDPAKLDDALKGTVEELLAQVQLAAREKKKINIQKLFKYSAASSPEFLVGLLRAGHIPVFERLFADLTKLPLETAQKFIYGPGGEAFAIAAKALEMSEDHFQTIFLLGRRARLDDKTVRAKEMLRALGVFQHVPVDSAKRVLQRWRDEPSYLPFLKQFSLEQFKNLGGRNGPRMALICGSS